MRFLLALLLTISSVCFASAESKSRTGYVQLKDGHALYVHYMAAKNNQPTVVLVNGLTFSTKDYDSVAQFLVDQGYGVLLYDAYGMGKTLLYNTFPQTPIKVDSQIAELDELMSTLKIPAPYNLFGLSYGGGILTAYAVKYPQNVKTLMMLSPYTEVIDESKQLILKQIAQTRKMFPNNPATDEELANYFIRQFAYQTYPIFEPSVLENPYKLEGVVKLVQGITPYRPIDDVVKLPNGTVHMMIGSEDEYVKTPVYDKFWAAIPNSARCSYTHVTDSKHKITTVFPYFSARWISYILQDKNGSTCEGQEFDVSPFMMEMKDRATNTSFTLPELKK
jgi:pimeloyl-ACP methyl ester carboxylesterase